MAAKSPADGLSRKVRTSIEQQLLDGTLAPGAVLDERSLAERYGVSRTPVREAVLQLAAHGTLEVIPRVGVVVPKLDIASLVALLEMLAETEAICAKLAARRIDSAHDAELGAGLQACHDAAAHEDPEQYKAANTRFHQAVYAAARNEWARRQVQVLRLRAAAYRQSPFDVPGRVEKSLTEHEQIAAAIRAGDEAGAWEAMHRHIAIGGQDLAEFVTRLDPNLLAGG
jgi:DNA-binding GntR family transcriptional regulator